MTTFKTHRHLEIHEGYQGINLTEFTVEVDAQIDNDHIVETFLRSSQFSYDSLWDCVKAKPDNNYLGRAFDFDKISIADFKKTNKQGVAEFLFDLINEPDWGDDRNEFALLLDRYFEIHNELGDIAFYMLSKDWFGNEDERLIEPEKEYYIYYFLIVSIDRESNLLTLTEWTYD